MPKRRLILILNGVALGKLIYFSSKKKSDGVLAPNSMKKIGLLSDTHCFIDPSISEFFANCDEIWHAGDFGNIETAEKLAAIKPLRGVYGNIDGQDLRKVFKKHLKFTCENVKVWITHIGGYPGHYDKAVREGLKSDPPNLFISGHSHILKVINDPKLHFLHINPGAAGNVGFHKVKTFLRFTIDGSRICDLEILEKKRTGFE